MAFNILQEPEFRNPVYNQIIARAYENNLGNIQGFKYLFKINETYPNTISNLGTFKIPAQPDGTGLFDAGKIIKQYLTYDLNPTQNNSGGPNLCSNSELLFDIDYGIEVPGGLVSSYGGGITWTITSLPTFTLDTSLTYTITEDTPGSDTYSTIVLPGITVASNGDGKIILKWSGSVWDLYQSDGTTVATSGTWTDGGYGYIQTDNIAFVIPQSIFIITNESNPDIKTAFNIVRQYDEFLNWNGGKDFVLHQNDSKFLTSAATPKVIDSKEYETLSFIQELPLETGPYTYNSGDGNNFVVTAAHYGTGGHSGDIVKLDITYSSINDFNPYDLTGIPIINLDLPGITLTTPPSIWYLKKETSGYSLWKDSNFTSYQGATGTLSSDGSFNLDNYYFPLITNSQTPNYNMNGDFSNELDYFRQDDYVYNIHNKSSVSIPWTSNDKSKDGQFVWFDKNYSKGMPLQNINAGTTFTNNIPGWNNGNVFIDSLSDFDLTYYDQATSTTITDTIPTFSSGTQAFNCSYDSVTDTITFHNVWLSGGLSGGQAVVKRGDYINFNNADDLNITTSTAPFNYTITSGLLNKRCVQFYGVGSAFGITIFSTSTASFAINFDDYDYQNGLGRNIQIDYTNAIIQAEDLTLNGDIMIVNPATQYYLKNINNVSTGNTEYQLYRDSGFSDPVGISGTTGAVFTFTSGYILLNVSKLLYYPINIESGRTYWINTKFICPIGMKLLILHNVAGVWTITDTIDGTSSITTKTRTGSETATNGNAIGFQFIDFNSNSAKHKPSLRTIELNWIAQDGDNSVTYMLRGQLSYFRYKFYSYNTGIIDSFDLEQTTTGHITYPNTYIGSQAQRFDILAGPANIDLYRDTNNLSLLNWDIIDYYTIQAFGSNGGDESIDYTNTVNLNDYSELVTYILKENCDAQYTSMRLTWLNLSGGFDSYTFKMLNEKTLNITKQDYRKVLAYNYTKRDRGETVYHSDTDKLWKLNSDWISQTESEWLSELYTSPEVYIIDELGELTPVVVQDTNYSYKIKGKEKLKQISITIKSANKVLINI